MLAEVGRYHGFPAGEGEMSQRIRTFDWSRTPLGPIGDWPQSLRIVIDVILRSPVPLVTLWGPDGVMIYNDAYSVFAGGRHPLLLGSKVLEGWPEVADLNRRVMEVGLRGETLSLRNEHLILYRPNRPPDVWVDLDYSPLLDESGRPAGVLAIVVETTERVLAEKAVRQSETQFRTFAAAMLHHVWAATPDGKLDWFNDKVTEYTGADPDVLLGDGWTQVVHPEDLTTAVDAWAKSLANGTVYEVEFRLRRSDGVYRWHLVRAVPIRDDAGEVTRWIGTNTDIDDRIQAERALRDRQADLARVQQIGKVGGVEVVLTDGFHNRRSPEYLAIHGLPPEAKHETHEDWVRRIHPEDREKAEQHFLEHLTSAASEYNAEYRIVRPSDGQVRWIAVKAEIERDAQGRALRLVGAHIDITDRRIAEEAVRESEQRFRLVSESAPVMLWMGDVQGKCLYLNRTLREFWGVAPEQVPGFDWSQSLHPDDAPSLYAVFDEAMREHKPFSVEARYRRNDGVYRLIRTDAQPRFAASGDFLGMIGVNVDITETRLAEKSLKESEERFRLIANSAPVPMWVSRLDGKRAFVNQAYMDFLGLGYEDCLVYDWRKALHPDDLQRILSEQIVGEGSRKPFALEARYRRADGEWRWLRSESQPRWGPAGEHLGFIGVAHDITSAKQAEIELRGLNETLEALVEARTRERDRIWDVSQDILVVADSQGAWLNVNPAATARLGWSQAELIGRTWEWIEHPDDVARSRAEIAHLAAGRVTQRFENRLRHKDGSYRWLSWTAASHEGLIYATARDVTDEKEAAETLRRTEEALRQSQKMEAVGQLTGGIAHDFNNLLQGIVGSLDLVQKRLADGRLSEIQRYVNGALTSANRAAALTHRLLAFSRRQPLDPKPVRANPLIVSMEDLLRRTMGERIELELALAGDLWTTLCDPHQLENSILNLAINARDAMPDGGRLRIETSNALLDENAIAGDRELISGEYVCITVIDSGTGMTPDVMSRAFDPFFTTKPTGHGTGLGLSMIYGFARQSDGQIKISSEVGKGTAVKLYLPRHDKKEDVSTSAEPPDATERAAHGQTVLVIEDEPLVRLLIIDVLDDLGYRALEANDGPKGLRILQSSEQIDLLITDIGLPGLNGRQVADAARVTRPNLKILFMTGYAENAVAAKGMLGPGMQIITKPFVMDVLGKRIRELMDSG
ncbi:MAG TPA: PAS domain S-box protein [Hyphomicrobiaceae bacterium]|nr:PAS domain S-box protein [Hyphomicrobiaceae bacterium]